MKLFATLLNLIFFLAFCHSIFSQHTPCYKRKKICNFQYLTNCYEKVAFDSASNRYYSRQSLGSYFDGTCTTCHRNGVVEQQITINEGKRHGTDTSYFPSGCPYSSQTFVNGVIHGTSTSYFDSTNRIKSRVNHFMGSLYGPYIVFNEKGDTLKYQEYENNLLSGIKKEYYENSKLKKIVEYKAGRISGSQINYDENGNILLEVNYLDGIKHGAWIYYFDDQKVAREEYWNKGLKNGDFITFNRQGDTLSEKYFKKDIPTGIHKEYYMDSKEKHVQVYGKKGKLMEEYRFDEFGVKEQLLEYQGKKKCGFKKKKTEEDTGGANMD
jgi:antitoxin component YwqK of YwqJK toxin-antitoxin module